jgi:hypothetical protein
MGEVISIPNQKTWFEVNLMKRQLRWHEDQQTKVNNNIFNFSEAIDTEKEYLRSFFNGLYQDQAA